jgi:hypothetical protein
VNEYLDVFPAELTKVPPDREVEFHRFITISRTSVSNTV